MYQPLVESEADAVFGSRMHKAYGGALKGGMPLYKYLGNRVLSTWQNRALGMSLSEFHSGYRAYSLKALAQIDFTHMTDDFHFDTEIIIKLNHQGFRIRELPIPTYYGEELCYVDGLRYAKDVFSSVRRYQRTVQSTERAAEYQEYFEHYPVKQSPYSSHGVLKNWLAGSSRVLDVGCGIGEFAQTYNKGRYVVGLDQVTHTETREVFDHFIQCDLENGESLNQNLSGSEKFDAVLLADILEHLREPQRMLTLVKHHLADGGKVLVSLPNVANLTVRLSLLFGRFNRTDRGILDRTHLHFYTRATAHELVKDAGYRIVRETVSNVPLEIILSRPADHPLVRFLDKALRGVTVLLPGLFGYQLLIELAADSSQKNQP